MWIKDDPRVSFKAIKATLGQRDVKLSELRSHFWPICVARMAKPIHPCSLVPMLGRSTSESWQKSGAMAAMDILCISHVIWEGTKSPGSFDRFDLYVCVNWWAFWNRCCTLACKQYIFWRLYFNSSACKGQRGIVQPWPIWPADCYP